MGRRSSTDNKPVVLEHELSIEDKALLNERQQRLLETIREKGEVSRQEYLSMVDVSEGSVYNDPRGLIELGILKRRRKGRFTYYSLGR